MISVWPQGPGLAFARRRLMLLITLGLAATSSRVLPQESPNLAEYQIKAAYLYKFLPFIEWPKPSFERADAPLFIGVLGAAGLADELTKLVEGRSASGHPVMVRKLRAGGPVPDLHVLFVGRSETQRLPAIAQATRDKALLIVTEAEEGLPGDSAINFLVVEDKVRFDVAVLVAERANLRISARLLTVARKVVPGPL